MRLKKYVIILSLIMISVFLLCCDKYEFGVLSESEINTLYDEIKEDIGKGELWGLETAYFFQNDNRIGNGILFLREATNAVFKHEDSISAMDGTWRAGASKNKFELLSIKCQIPVLFESNEYIIDSLSIGKYSTNDEFSISLNYHKTNEESDSLCISISLH